MGYHSAIVLVTLAYVSMATAQLPCEMSNSTGGFPQTGPPGGVFINALANQFADSSECAQECCNNADIQPYGCRAAWFYKDHDAYGSPRTVCQLWYCNPCTTITYDPVYESQVSIMVDDRASSAQPATGPQPGLPDEVGFGTTAQESIPQEQGIPQEQEIPQEQGISQDMGILQNPEIPPQGPVVESQPGYSTQDGLPNPTGVQQPDIIPQETSDPQQPLVGQTAGLPQPADQQQGQWVYDPSTGEYTFVNQPTTGDIQQPELPADGETVAQPPAPADLPNYPSLDKENPVFSENDTLVEDPLWSGYNDTAGNTTVETSTSATNDWWDWWPWGGKEGEEGSDEQEEEEWEKEWEEEEEEEEKEWEEELEEWEKERSTTVFPYSSTTYREGVNDLDDDQWLQDIQGLQEEGIMQDNNQVPQQVDDPYYQPAPADPFQNPSDDWANAMGKPVAAGQSYENEADDAWAVNAPVIAVGACAAVVLVLLLLVLLGKRLAGKNDRAQYKPLRESFSGSSTYHEDI